MAASPWPYVGKAIPPIIQRTVPEASPITALPEVPAAVAGFVERLRGLLHEPVEGPAQRVRGGWRSLLT